MRRIFWVILCVLSVTVAPACKSGQGKADEKNAEQGVQPGAQLPMEVPAETVMLLRADVQQLAQAYQHGDEVSRLVASAQGGQTADDIPRVNAPVKLSLALVMNYPHGLGGSIGDVSNIPDEFFDGLASDGTIYAAVSLAGNGPLLRAMENQVPMTGVQTIPRGFFVRMRLPADDPKALAAWLESACEQNTLRCGGDYSANAVDGAVVFDFRKGDVEPIFERAGLSAELPGVERDATFLERPTPAMKAFVDTKVAFGLYLRSERLAALGAYVGMTEAFRAMETATPENRAKLYARGMQLAGQTFQLISPEAREIEDSAFLVRASEEFGFNADFVASLTEVGAKVAAAGEAEVSASTLDADGVLEAHFAYDVSESRAVAVSPDWMHAGSERDSRYVTDQLRAGGIWTYLIGGHNYPTGFSRGLSSLAVAAGGEAAVVTNQLEYIEGARVSLTAVESRSSPFGVEPRGGVVAVFDRRAELDGYIDRFRAMLGRAPFPVDLQLVEREGVKEVQLLLGSDVSLGEPAQIPSVLQASLDLAAAGERATVVGAKVPQVARMSEQLVPVFDKLGTVTLSSGGTDSVLHARVTIGGASADALELAEGTKPVPQQAGVSECLVEARRQSAEGQIAREKASQSKQAQLARAVSEELAGVQENCSEHAEVIAWMRAQWLRRAGLIEANGLRFERAREDFAAACELDSAEECPLLERAKNPDHNVNFAQVEAPVSTWAPRNSTYTVIRKGAVSKWMFDWPMGLAWDDEMDTSSVDWTNSRERERVARQLARGGSTGFPVLVDRGADAFVFALMADQAGKMQKRGYMRYLRSNNREIGLVVPVEAEGRPELGMVTFFPVSEGDSSPMRVRLKKDGMSVVAPGVDDVSVEKVADILGEVGAEKPPGRVTIEVSPGVPFARLAELAVELEQEWATGEQDLTIDLTAGTP